MWTHPGKKLLFMGTEFAQRDEWSHERSLDWHLLQFAPHQGVQKVVHDLNRLYQRYPALSALDSSGEGFEWIDADDYLHSVFLYRRKGREQAEQLLIALNFTPTPHQGFRIGVPGPGWYAERFNSDALLYGGSGMGNFGGVHAEPVPSHNRPWSILVTLPPLAALIFAPEPG
jgi:1,4-alpha-glucan branching enzyme